MTDLPRPQICNKDYEWLYYTATQMREYRNAALEEALNCYSPDDTATDWADKIRALKGN